MFAKEPKKLSVKLDFEVSSIQDFVKHLTQSMRLDNKIKELLEHLEITLKGRTWRKKSTGEIKTGGTMENNYEFCFINKLVSLMNVSANQSNQGKRKSGVRDTKSLINLSDFTIICRGGEKIPTFRFLLAIRSTYFKVTFLFFRVSAL